MQRNQKSRGATLPQVAPHGPNQLVVMIGSVEEKQSEVIGCTIAD